MDTVFVFAVFTPASAVPLHENGTIYITFAKPIIPSQHQNNRRRFATGLKSFRLQVAHLHLNDNIGSLKVLNR